MVSNSRAYVRSFTTISHQQILVEQQHYTPPGICSLPLVIFLHLSSKNACKFDYGHYSSSSDTKKIKLGFLVVAPAAKLFVFVMIHIRLLGFLIWVSRLFFLWCS